ncbi:unnamed protein product, partial [marine sediment metagenome]
AAPSWKVYNHDRYSVTEDKEGKEFTIYCDTDRFEQYLLEIAPEDKVVIKEFTKGVRSFSGMDMPVEKPEELYTFFDKLKMVKMLPFLNLMKKWGKVSGSDFAQRWKNPYFRKVFSDTLEFPMVIILMMLAWQHSKSAGYVIGGALALVSYIQQRYLDLGGEIHFKARVEKILVENDKAVGIRLADGTEHRGDIVISAADGRTTIFDMLDGKYLDDTIRGYYDNPKLYSPLVYISLGVARKFDDVPPTVGGMSFPLDEPVTVAGKERKRLSVQIYSFD